MSAFIVNENHINVIVSYFVTHVKDDQLWYELEGEYGYMDREAASKVAKVLYDQNVASVDARYNEKNENNYEFKHIEHARRAYSVGEIAKAISGLEYQSCETDDYHTTDAYKILLSMRKELLNKLSEDEGADTWEISNVKAIKYA